MQQTMWATHCCVDRRNESASNGRVNILWQKLSIKTKEFCWMAHFLKYKIFRMLIAHWGSIEWHCCDKEIETNFSNLSHFEANACFTFCCHFLNASFIAWTNKYGNQTAQMKYSCMCLFFRTNICRSLNCSAFHLNYKRKSCWDVITNVFCKMCW